MTRAEAKLDIRPGDRVWDPLDNAWRKVRRADPGTRQLFLADGGVMGAGEALRVLLPGEAEYDPRGEDGKPQAPEPGP